MPHSRVLPELVVSERSGVAEIVSAVARYDLLVYSPIHILAS